MGNNIKIKAVRILYGSMRITNLAWIDIMLIIIIISLVILISSLKNGLTLGPNIFLKKKMDKIQALESPTNETEKTIHMKKFREESTIPLHEKTEEERPKVP